MTNGWLDHVKHYHQTHPQLTYKQALQQASKTYQKKSKMKGRGQDELIEKGVDSVNKFIENIVGTPELQQTRTQARIDRRATTDARRLEKQRSIQARKDAKLASRLARRAR